MSDQGKAMPEAQADMVVVGCGGGGLAAGLTAAYAGASVVLLEKMAAVGGCTNFAEGIFAAESSMQLSRNMQVDKDEIFRLHMEATCWRANARLVRAIIDKSAATIDWLQEQGVEFVEPRALFQGGRPTWHLIQGYGASISKALRARAVDQGAKLCLRTAAKELIVEAGRIAGVRAEDRDGNEVTFGSRTVVIADGGFANNREMLDAHTNAGPDLIPFGNVGQTGDGIRMAWAVGAAREGEDVLLLVPPVLRNNKVINQLAAVLCQPYLWINQLGERFCDEGTGQFPFIGNAQSKQKNQIMFHVFDEDTKNHMRDRGLDHGMGAYVSPTTRTEKIDTELERCIAEGEAFVADSLEALAAKIEVDARRFRATVDEYNGFCDRGHDDLFAKDPRYLRPVRRPKFYAMRGSPACMGTLGGIRINERAEVLNEAYEVIPGLYAVGNCAGGFYGHTYDATTSGGALAFAVNSGRIAGENALAYLGVAGR